MKIFYVYAYVREIASANGSAGSPFYIGKGKGKRAQQWHDNVSHPKNRESIKILSEGLSENDAFQLEMFLIHLYGRINTGTGCLRNLSDGGTGSVGAIRSAEFKAKVSAFHKGRKLSQEHIEKMRVANTGKIASPETRLKLSLSHKGQLNSREAMESCWASNRGRPVSEERKRKAREGNLGKKRTPEQRARMSTSAKGKVFSLGHRQKLSEAGKRRVVTEEFRAKMRKIALGRNRKLAT